MLKSEVIIFELFHFYFKFHVLLSHFKKIISRSLSLSTCSNVKPRTKAHTLPNAQQQKYIFCSSLESCVVFLIFCSLRRLIQLGELIRVIKPQTASLHTREFHMYGLQRAK